MSQSGSRPARPSAAASPSCPGSVRTSKEIVCQRSLDFDVVHFTWNIENFTFYRDTRGIQYDVLESPHFTTEDGQYDWVLRLIVHPRPDRPGDELCRDSVQIFLHLHNAPRDTAHLKCQFVFVRYLGSAKEDHTYQISRFREFRRGETWGFRRFIQRSTLFETKNGFIHDDRLSVKINLDIIRGARDEMQRTSPQPIVREGMSAGLNTLYRDKPHADLIIHAEGDVDVKSHKAILCSRSPVFSAMLAHDLTETRTSTIDMRDVPQDVLETFLELIYTGASDGLEEHAASLLVLGEKYQVNDVKDKSLEVLRRTMSHTNVSDLLALADLHNAPDLKEDVMDFILDNWDKVKATEAWKELKSANPNLVEQLLDRSRFTNDQSPSKRFRGSSKTMSLTDK